MSQMLRYIGCCLIGIVGVHLYGLLVARLLPTGNNGVAHNSATVALTITPKEACVVLGNRCAHKGQFAQAIVHYQQALRHDERFADAHLQLSTVFAQQKKYARALHHYTKAVELNPHLARMQVAMSALGEQETKDRAVTNYITNLQVLVPYPKKEQNNEVTNAAPKLMSGIKAALKSRSST